MFLTNMYFLHYHISFFHLLKLSTVTVRRNQSARNPYEVCAEYTESKIEIFGTTPRGSMWGASSQVTCSVQTVSEYDQALRL